jgi:hypothetical protein
MRCLFYATQPLSLTRSSGLLSLTCRFYRAVLAALLLDYYIYESTHARSTTRKEGGMAEVKWIKDMESALSLAKAERKPILLDYFNPN